MLRKNTDCITYSSFKQEGKGEEKGLRKGKVRTADHRLAEDTSSRVRVVDVTIRIGTVAKKELIGAFYTA